MIKNGIDISYCNNTYSKIDFAQVKKQVGFCIIRVGYRGYGDGSLREDKWWKYNVNGCIEHNIPFGVYFFTQAITPKEAEEEAWFVLDRVRGLKLDYPIYIDTEESGHRQNLGRADHLTPNIRTECIKTFCKTIELAGYYAGIYCSENWINNMLHYPDLKAFDFWIANWNRKPKLECGMWQLSAKGMCDGIKGYVDVNKTFKNYPAIMKNNNLNGYSAEQNVWQVTIWGLSDDEYKEVCDWLKEKDFPHDDKVVKEE